MNKDEVLDIIDCWLEEALEERIEEFEIDDNFDSITVISVEE